MKFNVTIEEPPYDCWTSEAGKTMAALRCSIGYSGSVSSGNDARVAVLRAELDTPSYPNQWAFVEAGGRPICGLATPVFSAGDGSGCDVALPSRMTLLFKQKGAIDYGWFEKGDSVSLTISCSPEDAHEKLVFTRDEGGLWMPSTTLSTR